MKKIVTALLIIVCSFSSNAQKSKIVGNWLVIQVEIAGEVQTPYMVTEYTEDGKMMMMGREIGTWNYNKTSNEIEMKSDFDKDFTGNGKFLSLTDQELIIEKDGAKVTYQKLDFKKIDRENKASKLVGEWKLENEFDDFELLKIELPNTFMLTEISSGGGSTSTSKGTWMYNSKEKSIIFIGRSRLLEGKSTIKELSESKFVLEKDGLEIVARKETSTNNIERLTFNFDDFSEESNENSPWTDFDALLNGFKNVSYLKYKQSRLIPNTSSFKYNTLLSKITVNSEERGISLANLSITKKDTMQYSESYKGDMYNMYNDFFPQEELGPFRLVTTENITVPAGTFNCKVFEGLDGEARVKYWMILDKPGVYARIIREDLDPFDNLEYSIVELEEIK
jgi:hypothetical protein